MAGNAMEWVNDFLGAFQDTSVSNFIGSPDGGAIGMRILKGGSFRSSASNMHIYSRGDVYTVTSSTKADYVGFRLALGPIPDGNSFDAEKPNSSTAKALASSQELKLKVGTTLARLAFRDDEIGKIVVVEYAIGSNSFFEIQTKSDPYHPNISPNGQWIAYTTLPEGISGFKSLYVQPFNAADTSVFLYSQTSAAEPRWKIQGGDTLIYFATDGGDNTNENPFFKGKTAAVSFSKKNFGEEILLFNGSYHGGVSDDGSLAVTRAKLLRAHIGGNDTVWYHGKQACNVSLAPDSTKRVLFLDFGGKTGREFVSKNYTPHEYILIADSTGKLVQAIPAPDGYTFDHTEWTNVPDLIVATLVNADGGHSRIVLVDTRDSSVLHLVEGNELWHPSLWVSPNRNRLPSDKYAADSLGIYMTETSSIGSRIMKVKMDLFWTNRAKAQIAITGSSRTFAGVDPALLTTTGNTEAFNYSYSGQDMAATEFLIANYYLPLEKLKTLVIALNLDRWSYTDEAFQTLYNEVPGYIYDERHDFWQNGVPSNMAEIVLDNITPEPNEYNFYCYHNGLYRSIMIGYGDTPEITFRNYDTKAAQFNQEKLLSIIDLANSYGVNVVGVIFPQSPRYISNGTWGRYGPSLEDAKILLNFVNSLARQKSNFYVLDEYKNGKNDYSMQVFANDDHLNLLGAEKLTVRLDSLLQKIPQ
ncbi:uncharacterized protein (TIGR02171 family) [Fibrobacter sp. UWS1]|nr:uncharacterized protein (TIGR02171 family) [Fibrobacter sp. UWS1]